MNARVTLTGEAASIVDTLTGRSQDQTERHFNLMVLLMMTFFFTSVVIEWLVAAKWVSADSMQQSLQMSHDAFLSFFGLAAGIFHGMVPQMGKVLAFPPQPAPQSDPPAPAQP